MRILRSRDYEVGEISKMSTLLTDCSAGLKGVLTAPAAKSEAIRACILNALCGKSMRDIWDSKNASGSFIGCDDSCCDDVRHAVSACDTALLQGNGIAEPVYIGASGALLRMLMPVMIARYGGADLILEKALAKRGIGELISCLGAEMQINEKDDLVRINIKGRLKAGVYEMDGSRSSQFVSGLLIALPLLKGKSELRLIGTLSSRPYAHMTEEFVKKFGGLIKKTDVGWHIEGGGENVYSPPAEPVVSGDWSYAANFIVANGFGCDVRILGLDHGSLQPDRYVGNMLGKKEVCINDCPDLFPPLCVAACGKKGTTVIHGTARLAYKESDRPQAMLELISALGGRAEKSDDSFTVYGNGKLWGGRCNSYGDHRIAMASAIASCICDKPVIIDHAECVSKSAPRFFDDIVRLGGRVLEYDR